MKFVRTILVVTGLIISEPGEANKVEEIDNEDTRTFQPESAETDSNPAAERATPIAWTSDCISPVIFYL